VTVAPLAETVAGRLRGTRAGGVAAFLGVPYAAPPVAADRWGAPRPAPGWSGLREAQAPGPIAPQSPSPFDGLLFPERGSVQDEACLTLNIWTPSCDDARRPVMVWIHGGGFTIGAGSQSLYDGRHLVRAGGVVVVTLNYRLGALGFLRLEGVTGGRLPASGNEGLLDVVAALQWVRDNIAAFGGDPANVTLFGESAGAMMTGALLAMPSARGLFHHAILQSGAGHTALTVDEADAVAARFLALAGVAAGDVAALCALPVARLLAAQQALLAEAPRSGLGFLPLKPVIDGTLLPTLPIDAVRTGTARDITLLAGVTADEWTLFAGLNSQLAQLDKEGLRRRLGYLFGGEEVTALLGIYPDRLRARGIEPSPVEIVIAVMGDLWFREPCVRLLEAQAQYRDDTYGYLFDWTARPRQLRACHTIELGFVFGWLDRGFNGHGPAAERLAATVQVAWTHVAHHGRPDAPSVGDWPTWRANESQAMTLGVQQGARPLAEASAKKFWSAVSDERLRKL